MRIGYTYNDDSNINYSETRQIYELWPSIDKFKDDPNVTNFLRNLWDKGCALSTFGCWYNAYVLPSYMGGERNYCIVGPSFKDKSGDQVWPG